MARAAGFRTSRAAPRRGWFSVPPLRPWPWPSSSRCRSRSFSFSLRDGSRGAAISSGEYERDISAKLLVNGVNRRCGQFSLADLQLFVEVGEFPARVLEKEPAVDGKDDCKHVQKQHNYEGENRGSVLVEQNGFIGNE